MTAWRFCIVPKRNEPVKYPEGVPVSNVTTAKQAGGLAAFVNAVLALLVGFGALDWSADESAAVVLCVTAAIALAAAVWAHLRRATGREPVAVFAALVAFASSGNGVLLVFGTITAAQGGMVAAVIVTGGALLGVGVVRAKVTPTANLQTYDHVEPQNHFHDETGSGATDVLIAGGLLILGLAVLALIA